jgi:hypothetical protein
MGAAPGSIIASSVSRCISARNDQNVADMQRVARIERLSFSIHDAYVKMLLTIFETRHNIEPLSTLATGGHHGREEKNREESQEVDQEKEEVIPRRRKAAL